MNPPALNVVKYGLVFFHDPIAIAKVTNHILV